ASSRAPRRPQRPRGSRPARSAARWSPASGGFLPVRSWLPLPLRSLEGTLFVDGGDDRSGASTGLCPLARTGGDVGHADPVSLPDPAGTPEGPARRAGPSVLPCGEAYLHCMQASPFTMIGFNPVSAGAPTFGR